MASELVEELVVSAKPEEEKTKPSTPKRNSKSELIQKIVQLAKEQRATRVGQPVEADVQARPPREAGGARRAADRVRGPKVPGDRRGAGEEPLHGELGGSENGPLDRGELDGNPRGKDERQARHVDRGVQDKDARLPRVRRHDSGGDRAAVPGGPRELQ